MCIRDSPQGRGWLVDGDIARGVEGAEEEGLPVLAARLDRSGVVGVRVARRAEVPQVEPVSYTHLEVGNPGAVFDGDIDGFLEAGIRWRLTPHAE